LHPIAPGEAIDLVGQLDAVVGRKASDHVQDGLDGFAHCLHFINAAIRRQGPSALGGGKFADRA